MYNIKKGNSSSLRKHFRPYNAKIYIYIIYNNKYAFIFIKQILYYA